MSMYNKNQTMLDWLKKNIKNIKKNMNPDASIEKRPCDKERRKKSQENSSYNHSKYNAKFLFSKQWLNLEQKTVYGRRGMKLLHEE